MRERTAFVTEEGLAALRALLGARLWQVFSPQLEVDGSVYRSYSFSVPLENVVEGIPIATGEFLNVSVEWQETERLYLDYWQLRAALSPQPERLPFDASRGCFEGYISSVLITPAAPVCRIEVLQAERTREDGEHHEVIRYDHALRLTRTDSRTVVIAAHRSIADFLDLSFDADTVARLTDGCITRVVLE
jgi:hypothetical protein